MSAKFENSAVATRLEKVSFHFNPKEIQCQRMFNYCTIALISHASKIMLKIFQARLQQYVNQEFPKAQAGFRRGRGTRVQIDNMCWIIEKEKESYQNIHFCFIESLLESLWLCYCFSVAKLCPTLLDSNCRSQASLSFTISLRFLKLMSIETVMPSNHLILCHPLIFLPSIFPSSRVFSNESILCIRWPKYWSFSFNICPSNEYSGLIFFRMDWLDLLAVQGTLKSLLQNHSSKASVLGTQHSLYSKSHIHTWLLEKL